MYLENMDEDPFWIDEVFARGGVDELEAACGLAGESESKIKVSVMFAYEPCSRNILHDGVGRLYSLIKTWPRISRGLLPFFWYLEQAVIRDAPYVAYNFLFSKCLESENRKKLIISKYPELAKKLNLINIDAGTDNQAPALNKANDAPYSWVPHARAIYSELKLSKSNLSMEQRAKRVRIEMSKRFLSGNSDMAKRGGKGVPSTASILRHALQNFS